MAKKCAGTYDGPSEDDYVSCNNDAEEGTIWCKQCKEKLLGKFIKAAKKLTED